jgi:hypothetical protein
MGRRATGVVAAGAGVVGAGDGEEGDRCCRRWGGSGGRWRWGQRYAGGHIEACRRGCEAMVVRVDASAKQSRGEEAASGHRSGGYCPLPRSSSSSMEAVVDEVRGGGGTLKFLGAATLLQL